MTSTFPGILSVNTSPIVEKYVAMIRRKESNWGREMTTEKLPKWRDSLKGEIYHLNHLWRFFYVQFHFIKLNQKAKSNSITVKRHSVTKIWIFLL